jgi:hypothetical protein
VGGAPAAGFGEASRTSAGRARGVPRPASCLRAAHRRPLDAQIPLVHWPPDQQPHRTRFRSLPVRGSAPALTAFSVERERPASGAREPLWNECERVVGTRRRLRPDTRTSSAAGASVTVGGGDAPRFGPEAPSSVPTRSSATLAIPRPSDSATTDRGQAIAVRPEQRRDQPRRRLPLAQGKQAPRLAFRAKRDPRRPWRDARRRVKAGLADAGPSQSPAPASTCSLSHLTISERAQPLAATRPPSKRWSPLGFAVAIQSGRSTPHGARRDERVGRQPIARSLAAMRRPHS